MSTADTAPVTDAEAAALFFDLPDSPALVLAVSGSFLWNAVLSVASRIVTYVMVCAAFVKLRRIRPPGGTFRLPAGDLFAAVGFIFCLVLLTRLNADHGRIIVAVGVIGLINWLIVRRPSQAR